MKNFMKDMGADRGASQAGDYLAAYAAGLSPSAQPRGGWPSARVPSRRSRSRSQPEPQYPSGANISVLQTLRLAGAAALPDPGEGGEVLGLQE